MADEKDNKELYEEKVGQGEAESSEKTLQEESPEESVDDVEDSEETKIIDDTEGADEAIVESESEIPEDEEAKKPEQVVRIREIPFDVESWQPKTEIGRRVKSGELTDLSEIISAGHKILEPEIVDILLPRIDSDLLLVGQAKGKFGGGQRRVFKQCQKKTREGNKPSFATMAVIGNSNGFVGLGYGKARETVPAREKALRDAKRNVIMIRRGSGSWEGAGEYPNSIPFKVSGKCGSVEVELLPAPNGTGLCIEPECAKMLKLAGIKDVWSRTRGQAKTKINLSKACFEALKNLATTKVRAEDVEKFNIVTGKIVD